MAERGIDDFAAALVRVAAQRGDPELAAIAAGLTAPLRVAVRAGRRGVGRATVARALAAAGLTVTVGNDAELVVYVLAEVVKPEDGAAVRALADPVLAVLNKVDLGGGAPIAEVARRLGVPAQPMAGLLALAAGHREFDRELWPALQALARYDADFGSAERFVAGPHPVPPTVRLRLCQALDLPATSAAVAAVRCDRTPAQVRAMLRRLSRVEAVLRAVDRVGATARYRRLCRAMTRLAALAVSDDRISGLLRCRDTVLARMAAAAGVLQADGLPVARHGDPAALLAEAALWQRYRGGPVNAVYGCCAADVVRGSLLLWSMGCGGDGSRGAPGW